MVFQYLRRVLACKVLICEVFSPQHSQTASIYMFCCLINEAKQKVVSSIMIDDLFIRTRSLNNCIMDGIELISISTGLSKRPMLRKHQH